MGEVIPLLQAQLRKNLPDGFPRYEIIIGGESSFIALARAAEKLNGTRYWEPVAQIGKLVLEENHAIRPMTEMEKLQLHALSDALLTYGTRRSRA